MLPEAKLNLSTIGEIAQRYGVTLRSLRFYEEKELLRPIRHGRGRFYTENDETRLQLILTSKRLGFRLDEIFHMIRHADEKKIAVSAAITAFFSKTALQQRIDALIERKSDIEAAISELRHVESQHRGRDTALSETRRTAA